MVFQVCVDFDGSNRITINTKEPLAMLVEEFKKLVLKEFPNLEDPEQIRMIFGNIEMEDGQTLGSYGIKHGSLISMVLRMPGGDALTWMKDHPATQTK